MQTANSSNRIITLFLLAFILFITAPFGLLEHDLISRYDTADSGIFFADVAPIEFTIYIHGRFHENESIFRTNTLQRYGTGRFNYHIHETVNDCDNNSCSSRNNNINKYNNNDDSNSTDENESNSPARSSSSCLAVSKFHTPRLAYCHHDALQCSYPQCKTMIVGDEKCRLTTFDVRNYYSQNGNNDGNYHYQVYLPLGPRFDSWSALQQVKTQSPEFAMKPPSSRQYAFNAIFSINTGRGRSMLADQIRAHDGINNNTTLPIYTALPERWSGMFQTNVNKITAQTYVEVVLDSIFTLSPGGHNPECFRLYEAVEAGSIPVLVKDDLYSTMNGNCLEPLYHWRDAPIVVLDSWEDVYPTVERLLGDKTALDTMQNDLRVWYDGYMRKMVREFEDFMMVPSLVEDEIETNASA
jgi:hypothetical protein